MTSLVTKVEYAAGESPKESDWDAQCPTGGHIWVRTVIGTPQNPRLWITQPFLVIFPDFKIGGTTAWNGASSGNPNMVGDSSFQDSERAEKRFDLSAESINLRGESGALPIGDQLVTDLIETLVNRFTDWLNARCEGHTQIDLNHNSSPSVGGDSTPSECCGCGDPQPTEGDTRGWA